MQLLLAQLSPAQAARAIAIVTFGPCCKADLRGGAQHAAASHSYSHSYSHSHSHSHSDQL